MVTDALTTAMGAVFQQRVQDAWQPLAFFYRNLIGFATKNSTYDRELLAIYEAVRYFRHKLEARHFTIMTDHKPLTFAFLQKRDKCSPRQFNHLVFISQFTNDIRLISGQENIVADTLSRVGAITVPVTHDALAASQADDEEMRALLVSTTALQLEKFLITVPQSSCVATPLLEKRPYIPAPLRR